MGPTAVEQQEGDVSIRQEDRTDEVLIQDEAAVALIGGGSARRGTNRSQEPDYETNRNQVVNKSVTDTKTMENVADNSNFAASHG